MNLIFETSVPGRGCSILPECDVSVPDLPETFSRKKARACRSCLKMTSAAIIRRWLAARTV